ncbi:energy transducer TonB [Tamlana sp. I1]|uniref:energy transducer TonB n=1 Tax=Tamlana sp. I1 TaxID=2762061 RepID=UPI00188E4D15|nr:energy transducer TonB [Tamlana sp. I1]
MSNQKKTHELIRQNEKVVKKPQKHDANLQKNTTLYFQIGLIVCLLVTLGLLEMKFETVIPEYSSGLPPTDVTELVDVPFIKTVVPEPVASVEQKRKLEPLTFDVVPDETPENPIEVVTEKHVETPPLNPDALTALVEKPVEEEPVDFISIQNVPIYPGCERAKGNEARKKCMSEKITKLIQNKFDGGEIASDYGLKGRQKINVQFTIDKTGHVTNIKTRAAIPELEEEAERVIKIIPEMIPGRQHDKNVGVIYNLPILFQVQ